MSATSGAAHISKAAGGMEARSGAGADRATAEVVRRRILLPVTITVLIVTVACGAVELAGGSIPQAVQLIPFAVSVLVFGLPHGALDHLVPARMTSTPVLRSIVVVTVVYVVVGGATAMLWLWQPLVGFTAFILLTWFHWGQGDLYIDRLLGDGGRPSWLRAARTVLARGALPMVAPLVTHPAAYAAVVADASGLSSGGAADVTSALTTVPLRAIAAAVVLGLVALDLVGGFGRPGRRPASEMAVLLVFFAIVPPILAVGLYFTLWHSVRHVVRLELTDPTSADRLRRGDLIGPFVRFLRQAWPITAIAVAMLVGLSLTLHRADLGVYLALIAVLTTPHAVVVTWMDRLQRTWRARRGGATSSSFSGGASRQQDRPEPHNRESS